MKPRWVFGFVVTAVLCGCLPFLASARDTLRIVVPGGPVAPGARVQLRVAAPGGQEGPQGQDEERDVEERSEGDAGRAGALTPPPPLPTPPPTDRWVLVSGPGCLSPAGLYTAPYVVPEPGAQVVVRVERGPRGSAETATAALTLRSGILRRGDSCLGPGQVWGPCGLDYTVADELPEAIHTVEAVYPPSARARGIQGTVMVNMLVCRTGVVLDVWVVRAVGARPQRQLEAAALAAARDWIFKPATRSGAPIATIVATPFLFKL